MFIHQSTIIGSAKSFTTRTFVYPYVPCVVTLWRCDSAFARATRVVYSALVRVLVYSYACTCTRVHRRQKTEVQKCTGYPGTQKYPIYQKTKKPKTKTPSQLRYTKVLAGAGPLNITQLLTGTRYHTQCTRYRIYTVYTVCDQTIILIRSRSEETRSYLLD